MVSENTINNEYQFRRFLSQILAASVKMLLTCQSGLCMSFSGIVIAALTSISNEHNKNETLRLTGEQASWLGSIVYIWQPLGSIFSAVITDSLGRRRAMMIVNIPFAIAWFIMCRASNVVEIFIANSLLGFGIGLMEAPIMTYIGEICEPATRGILIAFTNLGSPLGGFAVFFLNTLFEWRKVGMIMVSVPIVTLVALYFVPETPHWLIHKGQTKRAEKSLCWLRGWVSKDVVANEFQTLQHFSDRSKSCNICIEKNRQCTHSSPTVTEKFAEFKRKRTIKPFFIVASLFIILQYSGFIAMTPYLVQIFKAYECPLRPDVATALLGLLNVFATLTFMSLVHFVGKRRLYLTALSGVCISSFVISCYGFILLPSGYNSFDQSHKQFSLNSALVYIPTVFLILWSFCSYCGILMLPWQMLSEVFAFKIRSVASGLSAAINYIMAFVTIKTYYNLETSLSLPENRSLEDIETHFSDDSKKITDWHIPKHAKY